MKFPQTFNPLGMTLVGGGQRLSKFWYFLVVLMCTLLLTVACEQVIVRIQEVPTSSTIPIVQTGSVVEGASITLSAAGAEMSRNGENLPIDSYSWEFVTPTPTEAEALGLRIQNADSATAQVSLPYLSGINVGSGIALGFRITVSSGNVSASSTLTGLSLTNAPFTASLAIAPSRASSATAPLEEASSLMLSAADSSFAGGEPTYRWEQLNPRLGVQPAQFATPNAAETTITLPYSELANDSITVRLTVTENGGTASHSMDEEIHLRRGNIDFDGDGLIDIRGLTMLHNMRHSLGGEHSLPAGQVDYRDSATAMTGLTTGCPSNVCIGYELVSDLNFDTNGNGRTWTDNGNNSYTLDTGDSQTPYFVVDGGTSDAWIPVGNVGSEFSTIFDGNGFTIYNLASREDNGRLGTGFFGSTSTVSQISNVHLVNALIVGNSTNGILVGANSGYITATSSSGIVQGEVIHVAGHIGFQQTGLITANYSTADVIATNAAPGQSSNFSAFIASVNIAGGVQASYASGSVQSTSGHFVNASFVAEEVSSGEITASYATGNVTGGLPIGNFLGEGGVPVESYGFGTATPTSGEANVFGAPPLTMPGGRPITVSELTSENAGTTWNSAAENTFGAWDFTRRAANGGPSLMYADYDDTGNLYYCAGQPEPSYNAATEPRPIRVARCGEHLPHQFGEEN